MYASTDETIVAVSSARGSAPRGIVRMSGPEAVALAEQIFTLHGDGRLTEAGGFTRHVGQVVLDEGRVCLPAEVYLFRAPRSYTGQDIVEFHVPGSVPVLSMLVESCMALGARLAEPGEFTARAFLAGRWTLEQVEAVAETIHARSDAQLRAAGAHRAGAVGTRLKAIAEDLTDLVSLVEADIDFSEEPIDFITPVQLSERLARIYDRLSEFLEGARLHERIAVMPRVVLIGKPNAGKSALLNALSGMDRAICSPVAGTTHDVLTAPVQTGYGEVLLVDTAGRGPSESKFQSLTDEAARVQAEHGDLVCVVVDLAAAKDGLAVEEFLARCREEQIIVVAAKIDLLSEALRVQRLELLGVDASAGDVCLVSAVTGEGIADLADRIGKRLLHQPTTVAEQKIFLNARQAESLAQTVDSIVRAEEILPRCVDTSDRADLIAFELRRALDHLGAITGNVCSEEIFSRIFSRFCIGK